MATYQQLGALRFRSLNHKSLNLFQRRNQIDYFPYLMASEQNPAEGTGGRAMCEENECMSILISYICPGTGRHTEGESVDGGRRKRGAHGLIKKQNNPSSLYNPRGVHSLGRVTSMHSIESTGFSEMSTRHKWQPHVSP